MFCKFFRPLQGIVPNFCLYSLNTNLEFENKAAGTQYTAGDGPKSAFEVLVAGDAWIIYHNTKTGVSHWDFVSRPNPTILSPTLTTPEECRGPFHQLPSGGWTVCKPLSQVLFHTEPPLERPRVSASISPTSSASATYGTQKR